MIDRMPPIAPHAMSDEQKSAAAELAAGPRGGVRGPFIALLRTPQLMRRLQRVGEYLRYESRLERRLSEFAMLIVARHLTQQFEWEVHRSLTLEAGVAQATVEALVQGARPDAMADDEALVYDFCAELLQRHGVADRTYRAALERLGEPGVVELVSLIGYFITVSLLMNVAHTLAPSGASPLEPFPR